MKVNKNDLEELRKFDEKYGKIRKGPKGKGKLFTRVHKSRRKECRFKDWDYEEY